MTAKRAANVIAERRFFIAGKPRRSSAARNAYWFCRYQVTGVGDDNVYKICGVDGFQAIELAMRMIGTRLMLFERDHGQKLGWRAAKDGDLGFPCA